MSSPPDKAVDLPVRQALMELCRLLQAEGLLGGKRATASRLVLRLGEWSRIYHPASLPEAPELRRALLARLADHPAVEAIDVEILRDRRPVGRKAFAKHFANVHRGLRAMQINFRYEEDLVPPSRTLRENRSFARSLQQFCERRELTPAAFWSRGGEITGYEVDAWRIRWRPQAGTQRLHRLGRLVQPAEISPAQLGTFAEGLAGWLVRNTAEDGTIPYKFWPSRGSEATSDNALRRFMATVWLGRWAARSANPAARAAADANLRRNLWIYFEEREGRGFIVHDGKAKLGAAAFAAMALRESPLRDELGEALAMIDAGIDSLWQEDGAFRTFAWPAERNDNQNFYPGEALLYWALRHRETGESALLERCLGSAAYYRDWHLANRNPAFVPWHSQACTLLHEATGLSWLSDWVFAMNDWLLPLQQREVAAPDLHGRFYDPGHPEYGPPHCSSTAVYLEGLADAFRLAERLGAKARAARYAEAIWSGLRNLQQLQFGDQDDLALYAKPARLRGAMRTEVYDNTVRIDNVQHSLAAVMKLLEQPAFLATAEARPQAPLTAPPGAD